MFGPRNPGRGVTGAHTTASPTLGAPVSGTSSLIPLDWPAGSLPCLRPNRLQCGEVALSVYGSKWHRKGYMACLHSPRTHFTMPTLTGRVAPFEALATLPRQSLLASSSIRQAREQAEAWIHRPVCLKWLVLTPVTLAAPTAASSESDPRFPGSEPVRRVVLVSGTRPFCQTVDYSYSHWLK